MEGKAVRSPSVVLLRRVIVDKIVLFSELARSIDIKDIALKGLTAKARGRVLMPT